MRIGKLILASDVLLAPIAGFSDIGFRHLARRYGAGLTFTEMISVKGLLYGNRQTETLTALSPLECPSAVQLFGADPEDMRKALALPILKKFDIIDINMGCPVNKIVKNGEGSALMRDPQRAFELVRSAVEGAVGREITVKIRSGFDKVNAPEFAATIEKGGASAITVHGRLREEYYGGSADWSVIAAVKQAVNIPVIGNGDLKCADDCRRMREITAVDGVMLARGALGKPWIFAEIRGGDRPFDIVADIEEHFALLRTVYADNVAINLMKAHLCRYSLGKRGGREIRESLNTIKTFDDAIQAARRLA